MKGEMSWRDAIAAVLRENGGAMHYTEITEEILRRQLRTAVGATPPYTVNATITMDISQNGEGSTFVRVARGEYALRAAVRQLSPEPTSPAAAHLAAPAEPELIVHAFGMYWRRDLVAWKGMPALYGQQQLGASRVDFAGEKGLYLLYDRRDVIYAGRAVDQPLGGRLFQHTQDRLNGRWDRFSWFGVLPVLENGTLGPFAEARQFTLATLAGTLEALLIEALEPPQNRKRGDDLGALEYLQVEDPQLIRAKKKQLLAEMEDAIGRGDR